MTTALEAGEGSASRPDRSLPLRRTRYPLYRRVGGPQGRSGQVWKISPPPGFFFNESFVGPSLVYYNIVSLIWCYYVLLGQLLLFSLGLGFDLSGVLIVLLYRLRSGYFLCLCYCWGSIQWLLTYIRTHDLSWRAAVDLRLRPRGHWDRQPLGFKRLNIDCLIPSRNSANI